jgi:hypothetical protein
LTRPRAADDFAAIRARMEELRRERAAEEAPNSTGARSRGSDDPGPSGRSAAAAGDGRWQQRSRLTGLPRR